MLKLVDTFFNLFISNLPTSGFKLAKSNFLVNFNISTPAAFYKSAFVVKLDKSSSTFARPTEDLGFGNNSFIYTIFFVYPAIQRISVYFPFNL